jgi:hypothetical protein
VSTTPETCVVSVVSSTTMLVESGLHFALRCTCGNPIVRCCCGCHNPTVLTLDKACVHCQAHMRRVASEWQKLVEKARLYDEQHGSSAEQRDEKARKESQS